MAVPPLAPQYVSCADPHGPVMDADAYWRDHPDTDAHALAVFARTWVCIATLRRRQRRLLERAAEWLAAVHADWCVATRVYSGHRLVVLQCQRGTETYARARLAELNGIVGGLLERDGLGNRLRPPLYVRLSALPPTRPPPPPPYAPKQLAPRPFQ